MPREYSPDFMQKSYKYTDDKTTMSNRTPLADGVRKYNPLLGQRKIIILPMPNPNKERRPTTNNDDGILLEMVDIRNT